MDIVSLIHNYNDSGHLDHAIEYIDTHRSECRVSDVNKALEWAGLQPKNYRLKDEKIRALLNYLKYDYMK